MTREGAAAMGEPERTEDRRGPDDPYARVAYRRLIAWEKRIRREGPFLRRTLAEAPERSVLDLGCGTGEHVAFFAREGARAVGLDRSESMIAAAREHEARGEGRFVLGDLLDARRALAGHPPFGLALCLGNVLPHLTEDRDLERLLEEVRGVLLPGGRMLLQILNYERILGQGVRHLPLEFREGEGPGEEIVFLRLLKPAGEGRILFFPTTLVLSPEAEAPVRVESTRRVPLRAWTARDLAPRFEGAGFSVRLLGDMTGGPYEGASSPDLVLVARRDL